MDVVSMEGNQMTRPVRFWGAGLGSALAFSACSMLTVPPPSHTQSLAVAEEIEVDMLPPTEAEGEAVWRKAVASDARRILISLEQRRLWLMEGNETLFTAPVAVGTGDTFEFGDQSWTFDTPRGERKIRGKETDPVWVPPNWHYYEEAVKRDLEPVHLENGQRYELSDGSVIHVRDDQVGRINEYGNFWPFTPGTEIIFDGKIFVPPFGTAQRRIPKTLGTHKIDLGDAYLIHGTYDEESIGEAASHGCIRMYNEDVAMLYDKVQQGMAVFIY
jgi:hypothetical protein